jgi:hypothetical protein
MFMLWINKVIVDAIRYDSFPTSDLQTADRIRKLC